MRPNICSARQDPGAHAVRETLWADDRPLSTPFPEWRRVSAGQEISALVQPSCRLEAVAALSEISLSQTATGPCPPIAQLRVSLSAHFFKSPIFLHIPA